MCKVASLVGYMQGIGVGYGAGLCTHHLLYIKEGMFAQELRSGRKPKAVLEVISSRNVVCGYCFPPEGTAGMSG